MNTTNQVSNNPYQSAVGPAMTHLWEPTFWKADTDRMILKSDVTYHKLFVRPGYNIINMYLPVT